jgi:hypothetical protein
LRQELEEEKSLVIIEGDPSIVRRRIQTVVAAKKLKKERRKAIKM